MPRVFVVSEFTFLDFSLSSGIFTVRLAGSLDGRSGVTTKTFDLNFDGKPEKTATAQYLLTLLREAWGHAGNIAVTLDDRGKIIVPAATPAVAATGKGTETVIQKTVEHTETLIVKTTEKPPGPKS